MTDEEAYKFARRAIMHAAFRDSGSGGVCNSEFSFLLVLVFCFLLLFFEN